MNRRPLWMTLLLYASAVALAAAAVGPAVWLIGTAFAPTSVPVDRLPAPNELTLDNFRGAWEEGRLMRPLINSLIVTAVQAVLNVLLAAMAAYPLARMRFPGRSLIFVLILATIMIPDQVIVGPLFATIVKLGLYDTLAAVFLPFAVTAFGVYLCRQAMLAVPLELEEAARLDGANALRTWWHVVLPLTRPTLATLAVFSVIAAWSSLLWPLIVLDQQEHFTLPVAINHLMGVFATNIRYAYAGSVLALVPVLVMFLLMQRFLERGLLAGAVKG